MTNSVDINKFSIASERKFAEDNDEMVMSGFYYRSILNVGKCISINKVLRDKHEFDKDGKCFFCTEERK